MWITESVAETDLEKERIWALWEDVKNWKNWNTGVEYSYLNGKFEKGVYGSFKTADGPRAFYGVFEIKNCVPNKSFTGRVDLLLCKMDLGHEIIEGEKGIKIRHYIKLSGILTFYHKKKLGEMMGKKLGKSIKRLVEMAGGDK